MKYDQLVTHVDELGEGDISLGCIRFFQQRGILHRERICDRCGKDMRISTDRGNYVWRCKFKKCKSKRGIRTRNFFDEILNGIADYMPPF